MKSWCLFVGLIHRAAKVRFRPGTDIGSQGISMLRHRSDWLAFAVAALVSIAPVGVARSNHVPEKSLDERVAMSDLVAIATVLRVDKNGCRKDFSCAHLRVTRSLKGPKVDEIVLLVDGPVAELDPACCVTGSTYLLFLQSVGTGVYGSTNGPFGAVLVP